MSALIPAGWISSNPGAEVGFIEVLRNLRAREEVWDNLAKWKLSQRLI